MSTTLQTAEAQILQGLDAMQAECAAAIEQMQTECTLAIDQAHRQAQAAAEVRLRAAYEMGGLDKEQQVLTWIEQLKSDGCDKALEDLKKLLLNP